MHTLAAKTFYSLISNATGIDMSRASDFKLLDRKAVDTLLAMREEKRHFSGPCPPGSAFPPPKWSLRCSPDWRGRPSGPSAASPSTPW